ncbi:MAG: hypothetical protein DGJ47_000956 [Rickettsiaceae bacterium]
MLSNLYSFFANSRVLFSSWFMFNVPSKADGTHITKQSHEELKELIFKDTEVSNEIEKLSKTYNANPEDLANKLTEYVIEEANNITKEQVQYNEPFSNLFAYNNGCVMVDGVTVSKMLYSRCCVDDSSLNVPPSDFLAGDQQDLAVE